MRSKKVPLNHLFKKFHPKKHPVRSRDFENLSRAVPRDRSTDLEHWPPGHQLFRVRISSTFSVLRPFPYMATR